MDFQCWELCVPREVQPPIGDPWVEAQLKQGVWGLNVKSTQSDRTFSQCYPRLGWKLVRGDDFKARHTECIVVMLSIFLCPCSVLFFLRPISDTLCSLVQTSVSIVNVFSRSNGKMYVTHSHNSMPIHLEIKPSKSRDGTKKVANLQKIMLPFGILWHWLLQEECKE